MENNKERCPRQAVFNPSRLSGSGSVREIIPSQPDARSDAVLVASWNVKSFSWKRCKNLEFLKRVAEVISEFDLIALQEVRDPEVLWLLKRVLQEYTGKIWESQCSGPLKKHTDEEKAENAERSADKKKKNVNYTEYLAFIYRTDVVELASRQREFKVDPTQIVRQPYTRTFEIPDLDLTITLVNVHLVPERSGSKAEAEAIGSTLNGLAGQVKMGAKYGVLGDFNLSTTQTAGAFSKSGEMVNLIGQSTMVCGDSENDNIWLDRKKFQNRATNGKPWTTLFIDSGVLYIDEKYDVPHTPVETRRRTQIASELSDHCPIWAAFRVQSWAAEDKDYSKIDPLLRKWPDEEDKCSRVKTINKQKKANASGKADTKEEDKPPTAKKCSIPKSSHKGREKAVKAVSKGEETNSFSKRTSTLKTPENKKEKDAEPSEESTTEQDSTPVRKNSAKPKTSRGK